MSPERPKSVKEALLLAEKRSTSRGANDSVDNKLIGQMDQNNNIDLNNVKNIHAKGAIEEIITGNQSPMENESQSTNHKEKNLKQERETFDQTMPFKGRSNSVNAVNRGNRGFISRMFCCVR